MENHVEKMLLTRLEQAEIPYVQQENMTRHTTFAIGGLAKYFASPQNEQQLIAALRLAREFSVPYVILGRGSNVLLSDEGFDGMVITTLAIRHISALQADADADQPPRISAACGASLRELALLAAEHGWRGLEFAYGIPGTLGGAIRMNAGAYGSSIGDFVKEVRLYCTETDQVLTLGGDELAFSYRHSALTDHAEWVCLSATLELAVQASDDRSLQERQADIRVVMEEMRRRRRDTQPLTYPSAGSVFKRPEGHFAGKLIEDCGLKGKSIGGAQISEKHAGFIINRGGATAADVRALIRLIQSEVMDRFGVALEEEVVFIDGEK